MIPTRLTLLGSLFLAAFLVPASSADPLPVNEPTWPMEVLSWDLDKALPGVEYSYRLAVRGGFYPYTFALLAGPAGMTVHPRTGEIRWTPTADSSSNAVSISITDSRAATLVHSFTVDADRSAFRFVAANGSDTTGDGSETAPWGTLSYASAHAGNTKYVYVKAGTYSDSFSINATACGRFLAWPGDAVTFVGTGGGNSSISIRGGGKMIFQGFTFDANDHRWLFSCDAGFLENVIWRRNTMHNAYSNDWENPAFIFFWDEGKRPVNGEVAYNNMVMQENVFFDLRNPNNHGASTTLYDVQNLLYEDNIAYDIDGRGVSDKDDGYRNTFRSNIIHDCPTGIALWNQATQAYIEIDHNLVYNCDTGIVLGGQPGYLKDVFVHHNTVIGSVYFSWVVNQAESTNYNIYHNIIGDGTTKPYSIGPMRVDDEGTRYHYEYPTWFQTSDPKVRIADNLVWTTNANAVAGYGWGIPQTSWTAWQAHGYDANGLLVDPGLDANHALAASSPCFGIYGRDLAAPIVDNFADWRSTNFFGADLNNDAISGPVADPDGCGLTNFARYAFGLPARGPIANPVTLGTAAVEGAQYLTLTFPRRVTASDLTYILESSTDLITWTTVPDRTYTAGNGPITAQDVVALATANPPRRFLRLRVTTAL